MMELWNTGIMGFGHRALGACVSDMKLLYWVKTLLGPRRIV
jgi:hypothetical protein